MDAETQIIENPELEALYRNTRAKIYTELETKPEPVQLTDKQKKVLSAKLTPCIKNIITENPPIKVDNTFNRLSMILCSYFKEAEFDEATAQETARHFIEGYPHSLTDNTPLKRRVEWAAVWNHIQNDNNYQFKCSYVFGLGLPGSAFECDKCVLGENESVAKLGHPNKEAANPKTPEKKKVELTSKEILKAVHDNEDGDARLFIKLHKGQYCFDHASATWNVFKRHSWAEDELEETTAAIEEIINVYAKEAERQSWLRMKAAKIPDPDTAADHKKKENDLFKRIKILQTTNRKKNILQLARAGRNSLGITGKEWDVNPMLLGCLNGVLDLKTGTFRAGKPEDFIKTIAPTEWKFINEPAPTWDKFSNEIFDDDSELVNYDNRLLGYGITGLNREHIGPFLVGSGRNGKGTLLEIVKHVLGDLAYKTESELLLDQKFAKSSGSPNSGIMALRGKRIVWASETSEGRRLNTGKLKELVGGDTLNARAVYGKRHVEFSPTHLLLLITNNKPHAPANDYALWQRIHLIPFNLSFVDNPTKSNERQVDKQLSEKLMAEASGILAWLVRGCLEYQRQGLNPPEIVRAATEEYRKDEDIIGHFIDDRCVISVNATVRAGDLYQAYKTWCDDMGHRALSGVRFGKELKTRFDSQKGRNTHYLGIGLIYE